jgi:phosphoserine phosphatase RsbU/P
VIRPVRLFAVADEAGYQDQLRRVQSLTDAALSRLTLEDLLAELLDRVRELLRADTATVLLYDRQSDELWASVALGIEEEVRQGVRVPVGEGFAGTVARTMRPVVVDQVGPDTVVNPLLWERELQVLLGVPLVAGGDLVGVLHVGVLTRREFSAEDVGLLQVAADRIALAVRAESSATDRAAAAALQRSLLPTSLPAVPGLEFAARYVPGEESGVGGDWYDVFPLPGDRLGVAIGDVAGHGMAAAVVMGRLRSALRAYALDGGEPGAVLDKLDREVTHFEPAVMATVCYAVVEPTREEIRLALAGHLPPAVFDPATGVGVLLDLPPDPPIGFGLATRPRRSHQVKLPPGGLACFYTDGLVERRGEPLDDGLDRLCGALHPGPARIACADLVSAMIGRNRAADDVAVLLVRRLP